MTGPNPALNKIIGKPVPDLVKTIEQDQVDLRQGTAAQLFEQEPLYDPPIDENNLPVHDELPQDDLQGVTGDHNLDLIQTQIQRMDGERLRIASELVNVFNHAVQVQAGRNEWNASDYAAFVIAMRSVDGIGVQAIATAREGL